MEELVALYFIDLTYGSVGQGSVSLLDVAKWFMISKPTALIFMRRLCDKNLLQEHKVSALRGNGFVYKYVLTQVGKMWLDENYPSAYEQYRIHVEKVIHAIKSQNKDYGDTPKLTPKEKRQIAAGQKGLFDE